MESMAQLLPFDLAQGSPMAWKPVATEAVPQPPSPLV